MVRRTINKYTIALLILFIPGILLASPPSRIYTYSDGEVIDPDKVTANEDAIFNYLTRGVDTFSSTIDTDDILDGTITNADIAGSAAIADSKLATISTSGKVSTTALTGTISSSNLSGVLLPSGAVFFMMTGSCPSGTTDVTATYSNKFIKVNATQGTSSGVVLTGTSDSHTLTTDEIPSHSHTVPTVPAIGSAVNTTIVTSSPETTGTITSSSVGGGNGHTHTISTATTLEPSSITCKMCQVN